MLVFWGVLGGLTLGAFWPGGGELTSWVGIVLGLAAGLTLRWAVRQEVRGQLAASEKKIKSELLAQLKAVGAVAAAAPVIRQEAPDGLVDSERAVLPSAPTGVPEVTPSAAPSEIRQPIFIREYKADTRTPAGSAPADFCETLPAKAGEGAETGKFEKRIFGPQARKGGAVALVPGDRIGVDGLAHAFAGQILGVGHLASPIFRECACAIGC